jgi:hypothetical protein
MRSSVDGKPVRSPGISCKSTAVTSFELFLDTKEVSTKCERIFSFSRVRSHDLLHDFEEVGSQIGRKAAQLL